MSKIKYTLGFIFDEDFKHVYLLEIANSNKWNHKFINGIGGKIDKDEESIDCMRRECWEEIGTNIYHWKFAGVFGGIQFDGQEFLVDVYTAAVKKNYLIDYKGPEGLVSWKKLSSLNELKLMENAKWMIPFCLDKLKNCEELSFSVTF